tara:strand:+ start:64 stop:621 length:558 start_codon:yes stop_codon:yes gene_type:complete
MSEIIKRNNTIQSSDESHNIIEQCECVNTMQDIYDGKFWLLPLFAQQLINFMYTDIPHTDNPRILAHHVSTKGMYVLQKAIQLEKQEKQNEPEILNIENKEENREIPIKIINKPKYSIFRDIVCFSIGFLFGYSSNVKIICLGLIMIGYIVKTSSEYATLSTNYKNYMLCIYMFMFAFFLQKTYD